MSTVKYVIGIDGGGTSTRAILASEAGVILGRASAGLSNFNAAGIEGLRTVLAEVVGRCWQDSGLDQGSADAAFLGIASVVNDAERQAVLNVAEANKLAHRIGVDHDIRIALTGGLAGEAGIALIAGTGSSCYGRNDRGEAVQVGGYGSLADDVGSAYWVGLRALQQSVRQADGRLEETALKRVVFDFLGIDSIEHFLYRVHVVGIKRDEIARLCPQVVTLSQEGDSQALAIMQDAVDELGRMVSTAARRLGLKDPKVTLTGGLATSGEPFQPLLESAIIKAIPGASIPASRLSATGGAVLEALALLEIPLSKTILKNLSES